MATQKCKSGTAQRFPVCARQGAVPTSAAGEAVTGEEGAGPAPSPAGGGEGEAPGSAPTAGGLGPGCRDFTRTLIQTQAARAGKDKKNNLSKANK